MTTLTDLQVIGELGWTVKAISDQTGNVPAFWRPPYGDVDNRVRAIALEVFGLTTVIWGSHFDSDDWCLKDAGGQSCGTVGPKTDAGLDAELQGWINGPKTPGVITLEHEASSRSVAGFMRNYPSIVAKGWTPKTIPDIWKIDWYRKSLVSSNVNATVQAAPSSITSNSTSSIVPVPITESSASISTTQRLASQSSTTTALNAATPFAVAKSTSSSSSSSNSSPRLSGYLLVVALSALIL